MKLCTADQMRALEQAAVDAGASLDELMEQAGLAVAQEVWLNLGVVAGRRVLVLVGPGNNGGDGLVGARHLADFDADVAVYMLRPREDDKNLDTVRERSVPIFVANEDSSFDRLRDALSGAEVVVDALLGIGPSRPIDGDMAAILQRLRSRIDAPRPPTVVAVDVPTGVDADSGLADPLAVSADLTVTFGCAKVGLYMLPGSEHAGRIEVVDIGLPREALDGLTTELMNTAWVRDRLPKRPKSANKGTFGRVLVVAGSRNYIGAARLSAEACYRAGAGLVTIACPSCIEPMVGPSIAEVTWLLLDHRNGAVAESAAHAILEALPAYDVLLIGPGIGSRAGVHHVVREVLHLAPSNLRACVVDADALNVLSETEGWLTHVTHPLVMTPHPGEMARLLSTTVEAIQRDRLKIAVEAADKWQQTVVLKGAHTIIAAPDGRVAISPYANPLLAVAGTGDVLAGAIAGLLAQGMEPFEAAACGVYVHGLAGEGLSEEMGDRGLLASELLPAIPRAIRTIIHGKPQRAPPMLGGLGDLSALAGLSPSPSAE